jgi:hypothetical protein
MLYDFKCSNCGHDQMAIFAATDYDKRVMENGRLKWKKCGKCKSLTLYRNIVSTPGVLGGPGGYVSMERYQRMHPDNTKRKQAQLENKLEERRRKRRARLDKSRGGTRREDRHKGYGEGKREERLSDD